MLHQYNLVATATGQSHEVPTAHSVDPTVVTTWPVMHWLHLQVHHQVLAGLLTGTLENKDYINRMLDFAISNVHVPPSSLRLWKQLVTSKDKSEMPHQEHAEMLLGYFDSLWHSFVTKNVREWLLWQKPSDMDMMELGDTEEAQCVQVGSGEFLCTVKALPSVYKKNTVMSRNNADCSICLLL